MIARIHRSTMRAARDGVPPKLVRQDARLRRRDIDLLIGELGR
jgi:hypothetical protein